MFYPPVTLFAHQTYQPRFRAEKSEDLGIWLECHLVDTHLSLLPPNSSALLPLDDHWTHHGWNVILWTHIYLYCPQIPVLYCLGTTTGRIMVDPGKKLLGCGRQKFGMFMCSSLSHWNGANMYIMIRRRIHCILQIHSHTWRYTYILYHFRKKKTQVTTTEKELCLFTHKLYIFNKQRNLHITVHIKGKSATSCPVHILHHIIQHFSNFLQAQLWNQ